MLRLILLGICMFSFLVSSIVMADRMELPSVVTINSIPMYDQIAMRLVRHIRENEKSILIESSRGRISLNERSESEIFKKIAILYDNSKNKSGWQYTECESGQHSCFPAIKIKDETIIDAVFN